MGFACGFVGLPNVGTSTLFNALSHGGAAAANFPFCTIEPNTGIVPVPDPRVDALAKLEKSAKIVPAAMKFIDIVGSDIFWNGIGSGFSVSHIVSPICISAIPETATIDPTVASLTLTLFRPSYSYSAETLTFFCLSGS